MLDEEWTKVIILNSSDLDVFLFRYINFDTEFRVKYLDREDIEELGWVVNSRKDYTFNDYYMHWNTGDNPKWMEIVKGEEYIFKGVLKNKSELKVIMKQLGI